MSTRPDGPGSVPAWSDGAVDARAVRDPRRYTPGGELGRGGMGVVAVAVDTWLDRDVAVKRPRPDRPASYAARLLREARITARLGHPAIPPVFDVGEDEQGWYYTMPVLVGSTLRTRIADGSLRLLVEAVATACRAAGFAHARGIVHRDLKPDNVLLGAHGEVWVVDWGVAFDPGEPDAARVGTEGFQAPEAAATPASDVYGLGQTLRAVLDGRTERLPELRAVVARATATDPAARYADGAAMAEDLERWLDGRLVRAHRYPFREVVAHSLARWRVPLAAGAVALCVVGALGVQALEAQRAQRARADRHLSLALAQQADALRRVDARPEAEVLAAGSLLLRENPLARGVAMAWSASPTVALVEARPSPCDRPWVEPGGAAICADGALRVFDPAGRPLPLPPVDPSAVVDARRYGDWVVFRRSSNTLVVGGPGGWRESPRMLGALGLADGPVPAVFDTRRVGRLDLATGGIAWGPPTCEQIECALVRGDEVLIGCRERTFFMGPFDDPGAPIEVPGAPSALAWVDGPVVGVFEGRVLTRGPAGWSGSPSPVGPPRQLVVGPEGRVAVVGERGQVQLWSAPAGAWLGALPGGGSAVAWVDGDLVVYGSTARRFRVHEDLRPVTFDRADQGGIGAFDVSPSGTRLVAGSATGEVVTWDTATGAARREVDPGDTTVKSVRFLDERHIAHTTSSGVWWREVDGGSARPYSKRVSRAMQRFGDRLALLGWAPELVLAGEGEESLPLPARPVAAAAGDTLWVADEQGGVHALVGGTLVRQFTLGSPSGALAARGGDLVFADGSTVEVRGVDGAVRWRGEGKAPLTALDADGDWVATGDLEGRVALWSATGALVAEVAGHERRVSHVLLRGDVLYSASWDGRVRAWGLQAATATAAALAARAEERWGLSVEEALAGASR